MQVKTMYAMSMKVIFRLFNCLKIYFSLRLQKEFTLSNIKRKRA